MKFDFGKSHNVILESKSHLISNSLDILLFKHNLTNIRTLDCCQNLVKTAVSQSKKMFVCENPGGQKKSTRQAGNPLFPNFLTIHTK